MLITLNEHYLLLMRLQKWVNQKIMWRNCRGDKEKYILSPSKIHLIRNPYYEPNRKEFPFISYTMPRELRKRLEEAGYIINRRKPYMVRPRS